TEHQPALLADADERRRHLEDDQRAALLEAAAHLLERLDRRERVVERGPEKRTIDRALVERNMVEVAGDERDLLQVGVERAEDARPRRAEKTLRKVEREDLLDFGQARQLRREPAGPGADVEDATDDARPQIGNRQHALEAGERTRLARLDDVDPGFLVPSGHLRRVAIRVAGVVVHHFDELLLRRPRRGTPDDARLDRLDGVHSPLLGASPSPVNVATGWRIDSIRNGRAERAT